MTAQSLTDTSEARMRPPAEVMRLAYMGASFQTRISFIRCLIRRMHREQWHMDRTRFVLDGDGYGRTLYVVTTLERRYSLVCFSHFLEPEHRTDRVIAEAWDEEARSWSLFRDTGDVAVCPNLQGQE